MKLTRRDFSRLAGTTVLAATAPGLFAPALAQNKPLRIGVVAADVMTWGSRPVRWIRSAA